MRGRIIVTEKISEEGMGVLTSSADVERAFGIGRDALLTRIAAFDAVIVRSRTLVDRELLDRGEHLRVVGRAGVGVDNVDIPYATSKGVMVVNAPESNTVSAAEHTMALMLALARRLTQVDRELKGGAWIKKGRHGVELYGKTLGIVGLGRVGSTVAVRASGFGMKVVAYDPYIQRERFEAFGAERAESLDDLMHRADYISLHTPKTEETYGMIGRSELAAAKDRVRIINTARGGIVNESALVEALASGKVAGAAVDVFDSEPLESHALFDFEQVVVTPHVGGSTEEAQVRVGVAIAEQVIEALAGKLPGYALNIPLTDVETLSFVRKFLPLAGAMGSFYTQLYGAPTERIEISYGGEIARYRTDLVTSAVLEGVLTPILGDSVNIVNARCAAEQRGIEITEARTTKSVGFSSVLTVRGADGRGRSLSGTLHGDSDLRIVEIDGFDVDVVPAGDVLVCWHAGAAVMQTGVVGRVGVMLGEAGVNISRMEVGRQIIDDRAIMVISPSGDVPSEAVDELSGMAGIREARLVRLGQPAQT